MRKISIAAGKTPRLIQHLVRLCCVAVLQTLRTAGSSTNMLTIIFRIILAIVHYGYTNFEKVRSRLKYARLSCAKIYCRLRFGSKCDMCTADLETLRLKQTVENVDKLPVHLCILLGPGDEERIEFSHLARILRWSIIAGIPYVSFYDQDGEF